MSTLRQSSSTPRAMTTAAMEPTETPVEGGEPKSVPQTDSFPEAVQGPDPSNKLEAPRVSEPEDANAEAEEPTSDRPPENTTSETPGAEEQQNTPLPPSPGNHAHSLSYDATTSSLKEALSSGKANSTTELAIKDTDAAELSTALSTPIRRLPSSLSSSSIEDQDISTIPDPRLRAQKLASGSRNDEADNEVTALSTKLIDAINYQTTLDDTLSKTRMELEESREQVRKLEELSSRQKEFLAGGLWVRKSTVEEEKAQILAKTREEKRLRVEAEEAKMKMELELEALTAELFEQANIMVSAAKEEARKEQLAAARRYDNLKAQLADTEGLLRSQQEQLTELKQVMEEMIKSEALSRDDQTTALTTPTSPGFGQFDFKDSDAMSTSEKAAETPADADAADAEARTETSSVSATIATVAVTTIATASILAPATAPPQTPDSLPLSPSHPMSFTQLLRPVLRYDTNAFHEFVDLIRNAQIYLMLQQQNLPQAHVRTPSSTSLPKTPPLGSTTWSAHTTATTANTTPAVPMAAVNSFATITSGLSVSSNGSSPQNHTKELKETKFYKRVLVEDIEPTLRLDTAPSISWLVRRNIMAAILEGTLVAEPVPNTAGAALVIQNPCSMCGESRRQDSFLRHHRFRLTESDKSTPYPLCNYCLSRVRTVCGFLVFLRMIKEGHWRASDEEGEQTAWEECVRLREQMFWARIGGGVIPANGSNGGVASGVGSARHSRVAGGGSGAHNAISLQANGQATDHPTSSASTRPSGEFGNQVNGPTKININGSPMPSPLSSPAVNSALGIENGDRSSHQGPSRPSKLSASVAAMVSGMGGHVS